MNLKNSIVTMITMMKMKNKNHYIYKITNKENGKFYIGKRSTKRDIHKDKYMGSSKAIGKDVKLHPEKYVKVIICQCESEDEAYKTEALLVTQELVDDPMCYNLVVGGRRGNFEVISRKISQSLRGKKLSEETKRKMSESHRGTIGFRHSEESKRKMSEKAMGRQAWNKGTSWSAETIEKIRQSAKNRKKACTHDRARKKK